MHLRVAAGVHEGAVQDPSGEVLGEILVGVPRVHQQDGCVVILVPDCSPCSVKSRGHQSSLAQCSLPQRETHDEQCRTETQQPGQRPATAPREA